MPEVGCIDVGEEDTVEVFPLCSCFAPLARGAVYVASADVSAQGFRGENIIYFGFGKACGMRLMVRVLLRGGEAVRCVLMGVPEQVCILHVF